jgi:biopolymer transport protein ExbD
MAKRDIPEINAGSMADIAFLLLIFFLVTTTMDRDTAYVRKIPKKVKVQMDPVKVEERNIFSLLANSKNQLMAGSGTGKKRPLEMMENPDEISDRVIEWYTMNENLTGAESKAASTNPAHPGYNYPFYTRVAMPEIKKNLEAAEAQLEEWENTPNASEDMIRVKQNEVDEWDKRRRALELYGKQELPEIYYQAHVRIEVQKATEYELFAKIHSELEEAIFELRDKAAKEVFGEPYGSIKKRYEANEGDREKQAEAMEDKKKLDLLEILYPARFIEVAPKR